MIHAKLILLMFASSEALPLHSSDIPALDSKVGALDNDDVLNNCLIGMEWRTEEKVKTMSEDDKRNTAIIELNLSGKGTIQSLQGKTDGQLSEICEELLPTFTISGVGIEQDGSYYKVGEKKLFIGFNGEYMTTPTYRQDGKDDGYCMHLAKVWWSFGWVLSDDCSGADSEDIMPETHQLFLRGDWPPGGNPGYKMCDPSFEYQVISQKASEKYPTYTDLGEWGGNISCWSPVEPPKEGCCW